MPKFERQQKVFDIAGVKVGGQPGEYPTVLIGSVFYEGHKIVKDPLRGKFDAKQAGSLIDRVDEIAEKTGIPYMLDVVGSATAAIQRYIDFVVDATDAPILVDSTLVDVKISGIRYAAETGLLDRIVYNSITHHVKKEEIEALRNIKAKSAVVLAYNPRNVWPRGRVEILQGDPPERGLLKVAEEAGIENILVDTAVLDAPSIGLAAEAVSLVKEKFGLPCGGSPLNAILEWRRVEELGDHAQDACAASAVVTMQNAGANFVLFGPIRKANVVFPAAAIADATIAYAARLHGVRPKTKEHPLYKIF